MILSNKKLPGTTTELHVDLQSGYQFPTHTAEIDLCPDTLCWDDSMKNILMIELTILYDTLIVEAPQRKVAKKSELISTVKKTGYCNNLVTLEVA